MLEPRSSTARTIPLFREEAIRERADTLFGDTLLPRDRLFAWLAFLVLMLAMAFVALLCTGEYARKARVVGWLTTDPGPARVSSNSAGTVAEIAVEEGALVKKGAVLMSIATTRASARVDDVEQRLVVHLAAEKARLANEVDLERDLSAAERTRLEKAASRTRAEVLDLLRLRAIKRERMELVRAEQKRNADLLARGLISRTTAERSDDAVLAARADIQELDRQVREQRALEEAQQAEIASLPLKLSKAISALEGAIRDVEQRLLQAESAQSSVIHAPIDGRVTGLGVHLGQSVQAGTSLLVLVPERAVLKAELLVPAKAAAFLKPGLSVSLRYDSFPYQKFGKHDVTLQRVSTVALAPEEQTGPLRLNEPAYLATALLGSQSVTAYGRDLALRGGMTVQGDIRYDSRKLLEWILDPLYAATPGGARPSS